MELQAFYKSEGAQINIKHYDHESDTRDVEESTRSKGEKNLNLLSSGGGGKRSDEHNNTFAFSSFLLPFCAASPDGPMQKFRGEIVVGRNEMEESPLFHGTRQPTCFPRRPHGVATIGT